MITRLLFKVLVRETGNNHLVLPKYLIVLLNIYIVLLLAYALVVMVILGHYFSILSFNQSLFFSSLPLSAGI